MHWTKFALGSELVRMLASTTSADLHKFLPNKTHVSKNTSDDRRAPFQPTVWGAQMTPSFPGAILQSPCGPPPLAPLLLCQKPNRVSLQHLLGC
mmetsp:Transcript_78471/g.130943  ORF Transcript_78471/g.130943 Transcript_78471/m.130943 type:complete len:94 (+) Transcript_78471:571-852(+)